MAKLSNQKELKELVQQIKVQENKRTFAATREGEDRSEAFSPEEYAQGKVDLGDWDYEDKEKFLKEYKSTKWPDLPEEKQHEFEEYKRQYNIQKKAEQLAEGDDPESLTPGLGLHGDDDMAPMDKNAFFRDIQEGTRAAAKDIRSLSSRLLGAGSVADEYLRENEIRQRAASIEDKDSIGPSWLHKGARGATRNLEQMFLASPTGPAGIIGSFAGLEGNRAIKEAKDAGLEGSDKWQFVGRSAVLEGGIAGAFQLVGLGGLEKIIGRGGYATTKGIRGALKQSGKGIAHEMPEEQITEITQAVNQKLSQVDEDALTKERLGRLIRDTAVQTVMSVGVASGVRSAAQQEMLSKRDEAAQKLAESYGLSENQARQAIEKAGQAKRQKKIAAKGEKAKKESGTEAFNRVLGKELEKQAVISEDGAKGWVLANPDTAEQFAQEVTKETPSRKDFRKYDLPDMPKEQRQQAVQNIRMALENPQIQEMLGHATFETAQQEIQETETAPEGPTPTEATEAARTPSLEEDIDQTIPEPEIERTVKGETAETAEVYEGRPEVNLRRSEPQGFATFEQEAEPSRAGKAYQQTRIVPEEQGFEDLVKEAKQRGIEKPRVKSRKQLAQQIREYDQQQQQKKEQQTKEQKNYKRKRRELLNRAMQVTGQNEPNYIAGELGLDELPSSNKELEQAINRYHYGDETAPPTGEETETEQEPTEETQQEPSEKKGGKKRKQILDNLSEEDRKRLEEAEQGIENELGKMHGGGPSTELVRQGITATKLYAKAGIRSFGDYAREMVDRFGDSVKPNLKSWWLGARQDPEAADFKNEMDREADIEDLDIDQVLAESEEVEAEGETKGETGDNFEQRAREIINSDEDRGAKTRAMKQLAEDFNMDEKQAQEKVENELIKVARKIANDTSRGKRERFDALLDLYNRQPKFGKRTTTSTLNQAYSTPVPLAYAVNLMADVTEETSLYESTAGHGALAMLADTKNVFANEIEENRRDKLEQQGYGRVEGNDATEFVPENNYDRVVTNPPFGKLEQSQDVEGYNISKKEHLIAINSLKAMKDDGQAAFVLAGNKKRPGQLNRSDKNFINYVANNYNIAGLYEIAGELYANQGTKYPVRVIVVNGRKSNPTEKKKFAPDEIERVNTWDAVYNKIEEVNNAVERQRKDMGTGWPGQPGTERDTGQQGETAEGGARPGDTGEDGGTYDERGETGGDGRPGSGEQSTGVSGGTTETGGEDTGLGTESESGPGTTGRKGSPDRVQEGDRTATEEETGTEKDRQSGKSGQGTQPGRVDAEGTTVKTGEQATERQVTYEPASGSNQLGTLVNDNMADSTTAALNRIQQEKGNIDQWIAQQLNYNSTEEMYEGLAAEQVDGIALALYQIEKGDATIIGDQTGIGKGRQAAGIIRYAKENGYTPIFVTGKPDLFSDIYGDSQDIGYSVTPFLMGAKNKVAIKDENDNILQSGLAPQKRNAVMYGVRDGQKRLQDDGYDAVFATYSQFKDLQNDGEYDLKQNFLSHLAQNENVIFIMDESHNASGESTTGFFFRGGQQRKKLNDGQNHDILHNGVLNGSGVKGAVYLSATYAKNPDSMPLYFKTAIRNAVTDIANLPVIFRRGGRAMQQSVADALSEAGQMIRREQNFSDIDFRTTTVAKGNERQTQELVRQVDEVGQVLQKIMKISREISDNFENDPDVQPTVADHNNTLSHHEFSSVLHNYIRQLLYGAKTEFAIQQAIQDHKNGKKPLIALTNTMEKMINDYATLEGIESGQEIPITFNDNLQRALDNTLRIKETDAGGRPHYHNMTPDALKVRDLYDDIVEDIQGLEVDFPVSPIDYIKYRLQKEGIKVGELTGRSTGIEYHDEGNPTLFTRTGKQKQAINETINAFNREQLDAIILNEAGSQGISLHASKKNADVNPKPRHMHILQPNLDINTFVQTLGRIKRTGMVGKPSEYAEYDLLTLPLEAERRPNAVLQSKMASLNANVSADTEGEAKIGVTDLFNKYGDQAAAELLADDTELAQAIGEQVDRDNDGNAKSSENLVNKLTGRMATFENATQTRIYEDLINKYETIVEDAKENGTYDLEIQEYDDWAAELQETTVYEEGTDEGNMFTSGVRLQKYLVTDNRKPPTPKDLRTELRENLELESNEELTERNLTEKMQTKLQTLAKEIDANVQEYIGEAPPAENEAQYQNWQAKRDRIMNQWKETQSKLVDVINKTGQPITLWKSDMNVPLTGYITNVRYQTPRTGSPSRESLFTVDIMIESRSKHRRVTLSSLGGEPYTINENPRGNSIEDFAKNLSAEPKIVKKVMTGNLVRAMDIAGHGQIVTFRTNEGERVRGLLLPESFDENNLNKDPRNQLKSGEAVSNFLYQGMADARVQNADGRVTITKMHGDYIIRVPKSKKQGGQFFQDQTITGITGDFYSSGKFMQTPPLDSGQISGVINYLLKNGEEFYAAGSFSQQEVQDANDNATQGFSGPAGQSGQVYGFPDNAQTQDANRQINQAVGHAESSEGMEKDQANTDAMDTVQRVQEERMQQGRKPKQAKEVIDSIKKQWGIPIRGKVTFKKHALGWYNPDIAEIRMKDVRSVTVALHELGHHFDRQMQNWSKSKQVPQGIATELVQLGKKLYGDKKPPNGYKSEGFAEFIREYMTTDGSTLRKEAPKLYQWFNEEYLQAKPKEAKKLNKLQKEVTAFMMQTDTQHVRAHWQGIKRDWSPSRIAGDSAAWFDDKWRDMNMVLRRNMKEAGINEDDLAPGDNPYLVATAYSRAASGKAMHAILEETTDLNGDRTGESLRDALRPVSVQGGEVKNQFWDYMIARRALDLHERGINPGITQSEAQSVVDQYDSQEFRDTAERVTAWSRRVMSLLVESGAMTQQEFDKIVELNPVYVPFYRQFEKGELQQGKQGKGGTGVQKIFGSGREIQNPLQSLVQQAESITQTAMQADLMKTLVRLYDSQKGKADKLSNLMSEVPSPEEAVTFSGERLKAGKTQQKGQSRAEKIKSYFGRVATEKWGADPDAVAEDLAKEWNNLMTVFVPSQEYKGKENVIEMNINGQRRFFEVQPQLFKILNNLNEHEMLGGKLGQISRAAVGMQRLGATGVNMSFSIVNSLRDVWSFTINRDYAKGGPLAPLLAIQGMAEEAVGSPTQRRFQANGIDLTGFVSQDKRSIRAMMKRSEAGTIGQQAMATAFTPIHALRSAIGVTEAGPRIAEFKAAWKYGERQGMDQRSKAIMAANAAKDVTINFTRAGEYGRKMNEIFLFFNVAIQGPDKLARMVKEHPVRTPIRAGMYMTMISMLTYFENRDKEWWKDLPAYEKWTHLHWELPDGTKIRIPLPHEWGLMVGALPMALAEEQRNPGAFKEALQEISNMLTPSWKPAAVSPLIEYWQNKDWKGDPIIPETLEKWRVPTKQYTTQTTDLAIQASELFADFTGGKVAFSPAKFEHVLNQYTGGIYRGIADQMDKLKEPGKMAAGPHKYPAIGTLFLRPNTSKVMSNFYDRLSELQKKVGSNAADIHEVGEYAMRQNLKTELGKEWDRIREIKNNEELSAAQENQKVNQAYGKIINRIKKHEEKLKDKDKLYNRGGGKVLIAATAPSAQHDDTKEAKRLLSDKSISELRKLLASGARFRGWNTRIYENDGTLTPFGKRIARLKEIFKE